MKHLNKIIVGSMALLTLFSPCTSNAQTFLPASSNETMYPSSMMSPPTYNLNSGDTKYLSNFSHTGTGMLTGYTINIDGWSTDTDGGFSIGLTSAGTYTGMGAQTIPNAKDVQVGMLQFSGNYYIVASYYDLAASLYAYDLYNCTVSPGSIGVSSKLYTYHFQDPDVPMPKYISTSTFIISYPGTIPITTTMDYNRISMDVNKDVNKIAIALTDNATGRMYTAVGQIALDSVIFSSSLPSSFLYPTASGGSGPDIPANQYPFSGGGADGYTMTSPGVWDQFDPVTSTYVRYYTSGIYAGLYHYSHYPIDMFQYIFEWDGNIVNSGTALPATAKGCYSPLIRIKAFGTVVHLSPMNDSYLQYWPDVAFSGDDLRYLFYLPESGYEDIYVSEAGGPGNELFTSLFSYTGPGTFGTWPAGPAPGRTGILMTFRNTADGRFLSPDHFGLSGTHSSPLESKTASLPLTAYNLEMRAQIDAPDMASYDYAITFPYTYSMGSFDYLEREPAISPGFPPPTIIIHAATEYGKHNIYVRSGVGDQSVLTNATLKHVSNTGPFYTAINVQRNIAPDISFRPMSREINVVWASERASMLSGGTGWSYIAAKLDLGTRTIYVPPPFLVDTPGAFVNTRDYLYVANTPSHDCGSTPLVALNKHTNGQLNMYTSFTQYDGSDYSIMHKSSAFANTSTWRTTSVSSTNIGDINLNVGPNPFNQSLHVQSEENVSVTLNDITGRNLFMQSGSAREVNQSLDIKAPQLVPGNYILRAKTVSGQTATFKVTKQ